MPDGYRPPSVTVNFESRPPPSVFAASRPNPLDPVASNLADFRAAGERIMRDFSYDGALSHARAILEAWIRAWPEDTTGGWRFEAATDRDGDLVVRSVRSGYSDFRVWFAEDKFSRAVLEEAAHHLPVYVERRAHERFLELTDLERELEAFRQVSA